MTEGNGNSLLEVCTPHRISARVKLCDEEVIAIGI